MVHQSICIDHIMSVFENFSLVSTHSNVNMFPLNLLYIVSYANLKFPYQWQMLIVSCACAPKECYKVSTLIMGQTNYSESKN